jgi:hypothetical protein
MVNNFVYWLLQVSPSSKYKMERKKFASKSGFGLSKNKQKEQLAEKERRVRENEFRNLMEEAGLHHK